MGKEVFREKIRRLGDLVGALDSLPAGGGNIAARELVQLLLEIHGTALERFMEIAFEAGVPGETIIKKAGEDPIVRHLLLLHSLHPEELETRVMKALDAAKPRLRKLNSEAELVSLCEGAVQVKVRISGHACGSTAGTTKTVVEECMYDEAPDVESLEVLGPDDEVSSGFVSVDSLLKHSLSTPAMAEHGVQGCGAD